MNGHCTCPDKPVFIPTTRRRYTHPDGTTYEAQLWPLTNQVFSLQPSALFTSCCRCCKSFRPHEIPSTIIPVESVPSPQGEWQFDEKSGRGIETWADGARYEGYKSFVCRKRSPRKARARRTTGLVAGALQALSWSPNVQCDGPVQKSRRIIEGMPA